MLNQLQSDTLNPFEVNGQIFNGNACDSEKELSSDKEKKDDENNVVLTNEQVALLQDQRQELSDLRRQVVYLQVRFLMENIKVQFFDAFCAFGSGFLKGKLMENSQIFQKIDSLKIEEIPQKFNKFVYKIRTIMWKIGSSRS